MVNDLDKNRSLSELKQLRDISKKLGFRDDYDHWDEIIKERESMTPFWGRVAVMGVPTNDTNIVLQRDSLLLEDKPIPLVRSGYLNYFETHSDTIGRVDHIWYGDESGLQVILFDGVVENIEVWRDYYPMLKYPSIFVNQIKQEEREGGSLITEGKAVAVNLTEHPAWDGLFIRFEPLPELLQNRGGL